MAVINKLNIDSIAEWSLMFGDFIGKNPDAVTLFTKGARREPTLAERGLALLGIKKGAQLGRDTFLAAEDLEKLGLVARKGADASAIVEAAVEIAERSMSWDVLYNLFGQAQYDFSLVVGAGDAFTDEEKTAAFQRILESFAAAAQQLLPILLGNSLEVVEDKGGKRHSAADQKKLDEMGDHLDAAKKLHGELSPPKDDAAKGVENVVNGVPAPAAAASVEGKGVVVPEPPAEAAPAIDVAALTDTILKGLATQIDGVKAHVDSRLTEHVTAVDAKLADAAAKVDEVAKGAQVVQRTALAASAAAVASVRQPSAPGGISTFTGADGAEAYKGAPIAGETIAVEIPDGPEAARGFLSATFKAARGA